MKLSDLIQKIADQTNFPRVDTREQFVAWLKFAHGIMLASSPLLDFTAAKADGALRIYYVHHANEERDHAAMMAEDLASIGEKPELIDHAVAATAGAQYYYAQHIGPHALLGYCAAMEFRPMPMAAVDVLAKAFGEQAVRTVRLHAVSDVQHGRDLAAMIDTQPEEHAGVITYNAQVTRTMLAFFLKERMGHA